MSFLETGEGDLDTQRQREEGHRKTEAEFGEIEPQAKEWLKPSETGRSKEGFWPMAFGVSVAFDNTLIVSVFQNCERIDCSCFKPPLCSNLLWQP